MIEIDYNLLSEQALEAILEETILREGTDYGSHEYSLSDKKQHLLNHLKNGKAHVIFNPDEKCCLIVEK